MPLRGEPRTTRQLTNTLPREWKAISSADLTARAKRVLAEVTTFQELTVRPPTRDAVANSDGAAFEIVLAWGDVVRVPPSFDGAALTRLLQVLTQARAC